MALDTRVGLPARPLPSPDLTALSAHRLRQAKYAYTTRFVARRVSSQPQGYFLQAAPDTTPHPGDVVVARVVELGQHKKLESPESRRAQMFPGDEIVVAYGDRYAPDQFEAEVPRTLQEAHLVAAGGVVGLVTEVKEGLEDPTVVQPLGLLHDGLAVVSLRRDAPFSPSVPSRPEPATQGTTRPPVVALVGTSMNSGKSTAQACLVRGLTRAGLSVAAGKATGTGAGGDPGMYRDGGAGTVLDFTDFGLASTYRLTPREVVAVFTSLVGELCATGAEAVVVEIADGAFQQETARLLRDPIFTAYVDHVLFAAGEALSAVSGVDVLRRHGIHVAAVTGRLTSAPLAAREARAELDLPVICTVDLCEPEVAVCMLPAPRRAR